MKALREIEVDTDAFIPLGPDDDHADVAANEPDGAQAPPRSSNEDSWDQWKSIRDLV
jgi:hypothetical protein